jgi:fermentation-respiration switch protein FrsA (DUF1100 family)
MIRIRDYTCARAMLVAAAAATLAGCTISKHPAHTALHGSGGESALTIEWPGRITEHSALLAINSAQEAVQLADDVELPDVIFLVPTARIMARGEGWLRVAPAPARASQHSSAAGAATGAEALVFEFACWHWPRSAGRFHSGEAASPTGAAAAPLPGVPEGVPVALEDLHQRERLIQHIFQTADHYQEFRLLMPKGEPQGLVLHAISMSPGKAELYVLKALYERGWAVLDTSQLSISWRRSGAAGGSEAAADPAAPYRAYAAALEQVIASHAYAAEAAVQYALEARPVLRGRPIIITGFSMGAIMSPTIAARLGEDVAALVLVGGGANLPAIAGESPMTRSWRTIAHARAPLSHAAYRHLQQEYLECTQLDPYATAPLLRNRPVLVVQARWDRIVPARYGDLLWERLGRPERWMFRGGHLMLFWRLQAHAEEIAAWADGAARQYWEQREAHEEE